MNKSAEKVKLTSFDDLFGTASLDSGERVTTVPLSQLHTFKDHPFRVADDEKMQETVESIKQYGVLMPGIVRPYPAGGYEVIAGHRRWRACELAGLSEMPVIIREMDDDTATVIMVDTNIQREDILPSEKAYAYKMKYEALKHQGSKGKNTAVLVGETAGDNLPWVCVRDGNGVYSTNVAVYNVRQVPSIFLINRNNELKLRGEDIKDLEAAVKSLL